MGRRLKLIYPYGDSAGGSVVRIKGGYRLRPRVLRASQDGGCGQHLEQGLHGKYSKVRGVVVGL